MFWALADMSTEALSLQETVGYKNALLQNGHT